MYKILIKNTKLENRVNISSYNCSYNYIKFMLIQDLVFFDPPWGGQDYKNKKKINLFLDGINVIDIINDIYNFTKIVALKIPNNFDTSRFDNSFWYNKIFNIVKGKKTVYKLIIFFFCLRNFKTCLADSFPNTGCDAVLDSSINLPTSRSNSR